MVGVSLAIFSVIALTTPHLADAWAQYYDWVGGSNVTSRVLIPWFCSTVFYWLYGGFLLSVDISKRPAWLYKLKFQTDAVFSETGTSYSPPVKRCIYQVLFNQIAVVLPALVVMDYVCTKGWIPGCSGITMTRELPSLKEMGIHAAISLVLVEVFFYSSHRILHIPVLYKAVHKQHHEYKAPIAIAALYAHPFEALVGNTFAVMSPAFLVSFNAYTWYIGIILGWFSTLTGHSGYRIENRFHDMHHEYTNYNYGSFGVLDALFGTAKTFDAPDPATASSKTKSS